MGRIYLPLEDLNRFGVSEEEIMNRTGSPRFHDLMQFQAERARRYYAEAAPLVDLIHRDSRKTLRVMMGIYGGILDKIVAADYAVLNGKIRLTKAEKWKIVIQNWIGFGC